ncbi:uncharacterized protein BXZ73DRAFT_102964 [Epithele typhae]|uniref:uncharacterized protein n=1 Tax=Epithele typhae TaxID=378194 RepID=UPI0020087ED1|nr:uncharacterized protein BXZ73DRAFT_102964 [Epithele typhae]KAH9926281.1 hypothetical protein BXZ73DRAFT_102964 [Epithele typhae]
MSSRDGTFAGGDPNVVRCVNCSRQPMASERFQRCGGACLMKPRYCGRECQKAHWKAHKYVITNPYYFIHQSSSRYVCKSDAVAAVRSPEQLADEATVNKLMTQFIESQQWALKTITMASAFLHYGPGFAAEFEGRFIDFKVSFSSAVPLPVSSFPLRSSDSLSSSSQPTSPSKPTTPTKAAAPGRPPTSPPSPSRPDPAGAFEVVGVRFPPFDDWPLPTKSAASKRAHVEEHLRAARIEFTADVPGFDARTDTVFLVVLSLDRGIMQSMVTIPVFRASFLRHDLGGPGEHSHEERHAIVEDIRNIALWSLEAGLSFRHRKDGLVYPGKLSRVKKKWVWEPLFDNWDVYMSGRAACGRLPGFENLRSRVPPDELMRLSRCF